MIRFPSFGARKWKKSDHDKPLTLRLKNSTARIFLHEDRLSTEDFIVIPEGHIELVFDPAPVALIRGIRAKGPASTVAAELIYDSYKEAHWKFEALLCSAGHVRSILRSSPEAFRNFFDWSGLFNQGVEYSFDGNLYHKFNPKIVKLKGRRNPLYRAEQLVTPNRWNDMQRAADEADIPEGELLELYLIRANASWGELRIPVIEASIISETLLRAYAVEVLRSNGFSNTKINRFKDELTFNNLLNIVLPLSLSKGERRKMKVSIDAVDRLRGIRNDLVHGNKVEAEVDQRLAEIGIAQAIQLVRFLRAKISS